MWGMTLTKCHGLGDGEENVNIFFLIHSFYNDNDKIELYSLPLILATAFSEI